jgi:hypothetical protein
MGRGAGHPSAYHKVQQGWLSKCNGVRVGATATVTLLPLEIPCDGVQVLQIKAPKSRQPPSSGDRQGQGSPLTHYYVELRTPRGMDSGLRNLAPSVMIYAGPDLPSSNTRAAPYVYLLDQTPEGGNNPNLVNSGLTAGQSFVDPAGGVTIKVNSVSQDEAEVAVTLDGASGSLTCLDGSSFTAPGPDQTSCGALVGGGGTSGGGAGGSGGVAGSAGTSNAGMGGGGGSGMSGGAGGASGGGVSGGAGGASAGASSGGAGTAGLSALAGGAGIAMGGSVVTSPGAAGMVNGVTPSPSDAGCGCHVPARQRDSGPHLLTLGLALALLRRPRGADR